MFSSLNPIKSYSGHHFLLFFLSLLSYFHCDFFLNHISYPLSFSYSFLHSSPFGDPELLFSATCVQVWPCLLIHSRPTFLSLNFVLTLFILIHPGMLRLSQSLTVAQCFTFIPHSNLPMKKPTFTPSPEISVQYQKLNLWRSSQGKCHAASNTLPWESIYKIWGTTNLGEICIYNAVVLLLHCLFTFCVLVGVCVSLWIFTTILWVRYY